MYLKKVKQVNVSHDVLAHELIGDEVGECPKALSKHPTRLFWHRKQTSWAHSPSTSRIGIIATVTSVFAVKTTRV